MQDTIKDLYELCEMLGNEVGTANEKIKMAGGELKGADVDYIDKLTHSLKSVKAVIAMMEDEGDYSNDDGRNYMRSNRRSYNGSYNGSYAGRRYARRDSMGRYSRDGYSGNEELISELRELMNEAPDERTRKEFEKFIQKMEQ